MPTGRARRQRVPASPEDSSSSNSSSTASVNGDNAATLHHGADSGVLVRSSLRPTLVWHCGIGALRACLAEALGFRQFGLFVGPHFCALANLFLAARRVDEPGLGVIKSLRGLWISFAVIGFRMGHHGRYLGATITLCNTQRRAAVARVARESSHPASDTDLPAFGDLDLVHRYGFVSPQRLARTSAELSTLLTPGTFPATSLTWSMAPWLATLPVSTTTP